MEADRRALHALNRLAYGPRPGDVGRLASGGAKAVRGWIEAQLHPESMDDSAAQAKLKPFKTLDKSLREISETHYFFPMIVGKKGGIDKSEDLKSPATLERHYDISLNKLLDELIAKRLILAIESERQLQETLFEFWWNHFNVYWSTAPKRVPSYERDAIRPHLFGKFSDLLSATARHPAMLVYLDNCKNWYVGGASSTNENYARELMELHTIGVDAGYTQKDVSELSRILTGWGCDEDQVSFVFHADLHDPGPKSWLGRHLEGGRTPTEAEQALDLLAHHPATAQFVSTKLARYFVSDQPPEALVAKLARRFSSTGGDLRAVYAELFESEEFWSPNAVLSKTKRPFQFIVSALRSIGGRTNPSIARAVTINQALSEMGEPLFNCFQPNGYDDSSAAWASPGDLIHRMGFAVHVASDRVNGMTLPVGESAAAAGETILGRRPSERLSGALKGRTAAQARALVLASMDFQKR